MPAPMHPRTRRFATVALAVFCIIACCLYKAPASTDKIATVTRAPASDAMVFGMTVQAHNGDLLADPVVVGESGKAVQVHLMCEEDPRAERMSLTLEPMGAENGKLLYSYDLSVEGHVRNQHGTVRLTPGKERRISFRPNDPRGVTLSLFAAPLRHPNVGRYLMHHRMRHHPAAS